MIMVMVPSHSKLLPRTEIMEVYHREDRGNNESYPRYEEYESDIEKKSNSGLPIL